MRLDNMTIKQDAEGRYCLNDCHKASGGEPNKRPTNWLRTDQAQSLSDELAEISHCSDMSIAPVHVKHGGNVPGTYVVKELVYAYAMWISPSFNLKVIRAFDAMVRGESVPDKVEEAPAFSIPKTFAEAFQLATSPTLAHTDV